ncbi:hypothetical protein C5167_001221, partial [Papaver somniferum]
MIRDEIRKINDAHIEDEEYPDEVDTPLDVLAKVRFCKYQGLKSLRTSVWKDKVRSCNSKIPLPPEYARIFSFHNYKATQKYVLEKTMDIGQCECVPVGSYARVHVPVDVALRLCSLVKSMPVVASGLLEHESKMSVLHLWHKEHKSYQFPIKGKESLVFHVGFRQFAARPIFSADSINSNQHKMEKFLHEGRFAIASVYAPISFPPSPLIALKMGNGEVGYPAVAASGSLKSIDPEKIILKKIILTGYPRRVSKLKATVRYMFHDPRDVSHFKPVEIWTKNGVRGNIKESVGTHGTMKCTFNHSFQQQDTVCMSLFKRVYPKWPEHRFPILLDAR